MATLKQIAANRLNAARSTGPKSAAGKNKCKRNASKHGLTGKAVVDRLSSIDADLFPRFFQIDDRFAPEPLMLSP